MLLFRFPPDAVDVTDFASDIATFKVVSAPKNRLLNAGKGIVDREQRAERRVCQASDGA